MNPDARARWSWALYDWAAQPYFTVVLTFIFGPYFQSVMVGDPARGQALWGYGQGAAGLLVALTAPLIGAVADASGRRKPFIAASILMMVLGLSVTWFALPGALDRVPWVLGGIVLAGLGAEYGVQFTNAMLPGLAKPGALGRLSGQGWALGYVGGLIMLTLVWLLLAAPAEPAFGLDKASHAPDRIVGPLAALWLMVFSIPLFLYVPDGAGGMRARQALSAGARQLLELVKRLRKMPAVTRFLIARMAYYDAVTAVYAFGGLYAAGSFGWRMLELGLFGIILIVAGAIGVFAGGYLDDALGSKRLILGSGAGILVAVTGILSIDASHILFWIEVAPGDGGLFAGAAERAMLGFGLLVGLFLGPIQAASRTLMARLAPADEINAFFGLYALTGRATAWVAPLSIALLTDWSGSRRIGLSAIIVLLILGLAILKPLALDQADQRKI